MPVPEQGPVSLVSARPAKPSPQAPEAGERRSPAKEAGAGTGVPGGGRGGKDAAGVAALAEHLARSAMGAMETGELESAQEVDFEHLDSGHKAGVTEKFADAIERESGGYGAPQLPTLLDEVFRQDFIREPEQPEAAADAAVFEMPVDEAPAPAREPAGHEPQVGEQAGWAPEWPVEPVQPLAAEPPAAASSSKEPAFVTHQAPQPATQVQPLVPAQFIGPAQPAISPQASTALEGAVREMLRPLLVQWLNENMPRILENAIREEIAMRGLLPKSDR